jgi:hypothetical protein
MQESDSEHHNPEKKNAYINALPESGPRRREVAATRDAFALVKAPNARRTTIVAIE